MWPTSSSDNPFARAPSLRDLETSTNNERQIDEEEALRWAALERLPTYDRVRRGILKNVAAGEEAKEVDVGELGVEERRIVLERVMCGVDYDAEKLFDSIKGRFDK